MEKAPAENHFHYGRTTFVQKVFYIGIGIAAAVAMHSCSPTTFNRLSQSYERVKEKTSTLAEKLVNGEE